MRQKRPCITAYTVRWQMDEQMAKETIYPMFEEHWRRRPELYDQLMRTLGEPKPWGEMDVVMDDAILDFKGFDDEHRVLAREALAAAAHLRPPRAVRLHGGKARDGHWATRCGGGRRSTRIPIIDGAIERVCVNNILADKWYTGKICSDWTMERSTALMGFLISALLSHDVEE